MTWLGDSVVRTVWDNVCTKETASNTDIEELHNACARIGGTCNTNREDEKAQVEG